MLVTGEAYERCTVPASGRVYAPVDWRGQRIQILIPEDGYSLSSGADGVEVRAEAVYERVARPGKGEGPPQLRVGGQEGDTVLLVLSPRSD